MLFARAFAVIILVFAVPYCDAAAMSRYFMQQDSDIVSSVNYGNNPSAGHYADAGDTKIWYEVYGTGSPVLVLHGGGVGCPYEMGRLIDELRQDHQVIVPAARGHGRSGIGTAAVTYELKARDMFAAVNAVTAESFAIVGFSDGGYTAYKMALLEPARVSSIVTIGAGESVPLTRKFPLLSLEQLKAADPVFYQEKVSTCPEPDKLQAFLDEYLTFYNQETISKNVFQLIRCPVLLINGELDANSPLDTALSAYRMLPDARLAVIAGAPHQAFIPCFDAVWAAVKDFFAAGQSRTAALP